MPGFIVNETHRLTEEQRGRITAAIGNLPPEAINRALAKIQFEMQVFVSYAESEQKTTRPKQVNQALVVVFEEAGKLSKAIGALPHEAAEPLDMWFYTWQSRVQRGRPNRKYIGVSELNELLSLLRFAVHESTKSGRPPDRALRLYVSQLASIFEESTGALPTRSYDATRPPGEEEGGVAREFFGACLEAAGYKGYPAGLIKRVLQRSRTMDKSPDGEHTGGKQRISPVLPVQRKSR